MKTVFILLLFSFQLARGQELFVFTEPASNMPAKSIAVRLNNYLLKHRDALKYDYQLKPEIMWGISKKIMIHAEAFFSNNEKHFKADGGSLYMKYRFYSRDEVHSHFRMAGFIKGAVNNTIIQQPALDLNGNNSGYEAGVIATKLIDKLALSASGSFIHATDNGNKNKFQPGSENRNALSYSFSAGKLMLPRSYTGYKQTNFNIMVEILGQTNLQTAQTYIDIAPSVQFIFLSRMRLDAGYRFPVAKELLRIAGNVFFLRFEYNFFNVYK